MGGQVLCTARGKTGDNFQSLLSSRGCNLFERWSLCFTLHTPVAFYRLARPRVASFIDLHLIFHLLRQATTLAHTLAGNHYAEALGSSSSLCYFATQSPLNDLVYTYDLYPGGRGRPGLLGEHMGGRLSLYL